MNKLHYNLYSLKRINETKVLNNQLDEMLTSGQNVKSQKIRRRNHEYYGE